MSGACGLKTSMGGSIVTTCNPCPWTLLLPISPTAQSRCLTAASATSGKLVKSSGEVRTRSAPTAHLGDVEEESGDVAAGAGYAAHPSLGYRIRLEIHSDDRNGLGRLGHGLQCLRVGGEDDLGADGDELRCEFHVLFAFAMLRGSDVNDHALSDDVTQLAETFREGFERRIRPRTPAEPSDPRSLRGSPSVRDVGSIGHQTSRIHALPPERPCLRPGPRRQMG